MYFTTQYVFLEFLGSCNTPISGFLVDVARKEYYEQFVFIQLNKNSFFLNLKLMIFRLKNCNKNPKSK